MDQDRNYRIKDIAELFQLPVSTLHYWEKEGLLKANRTENKYRVFESRDFFDIWEIHLYRNLQVPVRELKELKKKGFKEIESLLEENRKVLEEEIREKKQILDKLERYQDSFAEWEKLKTREGQVRVQMPDVRAIKRDPFTKESMKQTVENPYNCCLLFRKEDGFAPIMCIPATETEIDKEEFIWKETDDGKTYIVLGIYTEINHMDHNNIEENVKYLKERGYEVDTVIARYLFSATEGEKRYDYHKAWFEVHEMDKISSHTLE